MNPAHEIRQTPMGARGGQPTAGNGGSRKNHHDHIADAQTNSHCRPWSIGYPQDLTRQGWAAPKRKPAGVNRRAFSWNSHRLLSPLALTSNSALLRPFRHVVEPALLVV